MSLGSPSPPPPVDQEALIRAQAEENRITTFTPLGDLRFGELGEEGQFIPDTSGTASFIDIPPESQAILDLGQATTAELAERGLLQAVSLPAEAISFEGLPEFSSELDFAGLPGIDFSSFAQVPGSIDASGFDALPDGIDRSGLPALAGGLDTSGFTDLPEGLDFSGLTGIPGIDDFSADAERVRSATFQQALGLLNPEFERQEGRLEQSLANRGLPSGGEAFDTEFDRFDDARNRALQNAAFQAVRAGGAEQSRLFGLATSARAQQVGELIQDAAQRFGVRSQQFQEALASLTQAMGARGQLVAEQLQDIATRFGVRSQQFTEALASAQQAVQARGISFNEAFSTRQQSLSELLQQENLTRTARQQGITEIAGQRANTFAELAAILGLSQPTLPQFNAPAQIDVVGPAALAQQSALAAFQAEQQSQSALLSGLFGLGSSGILAAGSVGSLAALGCWVAREVYGADNPKWLVFRQWMFTRAPKWLLRLYLKYGERLALWLHGKDWIKAVIRWWMDARTRGMADGKPLASVAT